MYELYFFLNIKDLINWVRGSSSVPTAKTWRPIFFPVQTEAKKNIYYIMANTFQIWKKLQANFLLNL